MWQQFGPHRTLSQACEIAYCSVLNRVNCGWGNSGGAGREQQRPSVVIDCAASVRHVLQSFPFGRAEPIFLILYPNHKSHPDS
ncbi:hypothetical protein XELAEV_18023585mg [Xenopus laevis]|uniref:Uncharacterized protein n=1 Tax=Xenopus laevis TaxID=8355 RepID=A0A974D4F3_XENLA|nr:hypothetical protein XELAEV_18023585mg [Xenopus laevis]